MTLPDNGSAARYRAMFRIRCVEEAILDLFGKGKVAGTTHTCIGQEANAVGVIGLLDPARDYVLSNHRNHGHFIAFGGAPRSILAEIMGLDEGVCGGYGGSQHIKRGRFLSNGVQGGIVPIAAGMALGEKAAGTGGIVVVSLGDGTLGEGIVYETLNMAALWSLPVLFLVENNRYAQSTPVERGVAGSIVDRARPFGIEAQEIDSSDVDEIRTFGAAAIDHVRTRGRPVWAVIHCHRLAAHSKGDDTRTEAELGAGRARDPLVIQGARLPEAGRLSLEAEERASVAAIVADLQGSRP